MTAERSHILLVNPWIHDFAAYDFWAKPLGLLQIGAILRHAGCRISYCDCLDRFHPHAPASDPNARYGRGPYRKTPLAKPAGLEDIPRTYSRYGIAPQWLIDDLRQLDRPDLILVTSLMTYWYPGVIETIDVLRHVFPSVPIVLGGIYAALCSDHARRHCAVDAVIEVTQMRSVIDRLMRWVNVDSDAAMAVSDFDHWPSPAFDLQRCINYAPLLTTIGCPFDCAYCAAAYLHRRMQRRAPAQVVAEIRRWHTAYGVTDFVFYDDALLTRADSHVIPILEEVVTDGLPIRFHTPNALHAREMTLAIARLMHRAGFATIRLGVETLDFDHRSQLDKKLTRDQFLHAVACLKQAGFAASQIGAYLLCGLPDQPDQAVAEAVDTVRLAGITPILAHYTPIPHTRLWPRAVAVSRYDLHADPVFTNNAVMPCREAGFSWKVISDLKQKGRIVR